MCWTFDFKVRAVRVRVTRESTYNKQSKKDVYTTSHAAG